MWTLVKLKFFKTPFSTKGNRTGAVIIAYLCQETEEEDIDSAHEKFKAAFGCGINKPEILEKLRLKIAQNTLPSDFAPLFI